MAASADAPGPCRTRGGHPDHGGPSGTVPKTRRGAEPRAISRRPLPGKRMHAKTRGRWRTSRRGDTAFLVPSLPARPSGRPPASRARGPCRCPRRRCGRRRNPAPYARPMRRRRGQAGQARDTRTACGPRTCGRPRLPEKAPRHARPNGLPSGGAARCRTRPGNAGCRDAPDAQARGLDSGTAHSKVRMRPGAHRSANGGGRAGTPYAFPGRSPEPSPFRSIQFRRKPSFGNGLSYR